MRLVYPLIFKLTITPWAFDILHLVGDHILLFITTTSISNHVFSVRITDEVARMDQSVLCHGIST